MCLLVPSPLPHATNTVVEVVIAITEVDCAAMRKAHLPTQYLSVNRCRSTMNTRISPTYQSEISLLTTKELYRLRVYVKIHPVIMVSKEHHQQSIQ